ncbi:MAG: hypothetical protein LBU14_05040 [Candidatus Peribacteria bacterium]|jgi:hypothetical protein|nr:hypothetical protein [Candidatus Peribacteria bacterium]
MMHRQENDVLRFIFNEIYKNQKEIHDKLSVSDTNDNMQANKFKMKIIKMVFDFNKSKKLTDPNSKNPEKIDWFVSEYDIWEEVDGNL